MMNEDDIKFYAWLLVVLGLLIFIIWCFTHTDVSDAPNLTPVIVNTNNKDTLTLEWFIIQKDIVGHHEHLENSLRRCQYDYQSNNGLEADSNTNPEVWSRYLVVKGSADRAYHKYQRAKGAYNEQAGKLQDSFFIVNLLPRKL